MNQRIRIHRLRTSVLALQGALGVMAMAHAQSEPTVAELTTPRSTIEVGATAASGFGAKANEYTGLDGKRPAALANVELRGGAPYDSEGNLRWSLVGARLGTQSPSLEADLSLQGQLRVRFGADQLRRLDSDSYATPYGGIGGSTLALPSTWRVPVVPRISGTTPNARGLSPEVTGANAIVAGVSTAPTAAQLATASTVQGADLPAFRQVDLFTTRLRYGLDIESPIDDRWTVSAGVSREHKSGLKATPAPSRAVGGDTTAILPAPVDQDDNQFHLGVGYTAPTFQFQVGYEGSVFRNNVKSVTWNLWADPSVSASSATAPGNQFHKLSVSGLTRLGDATTLSAHAAWSKAEQNEPFLRNDASAQLVPVDSAQAKVESKSAGVKLVQRTTKQLTLGGGYSFDEQDDRTPVNIYGFYDLNNPVNATASPFAYLFPTVTGMGQNFNINANTPYSRRNHQIDLDADYRIDADQKLRGEFRGVQTKRWCNGSWINCADAPSSRENTLRASWNGHLGETVNARVDASGARRRVQYDENAFLAVVPMAGQSPSTATGALAGTTAYDALTALGLTGYGPVSGLQPAAAAGSAQAFYFPANNVLSNTLYGNQNRISELLGMRRYNQANRDRQSLAAMLDVQASERLSLQGGLRYVDDHYAESVYGLQNVRSWAFNLDGTYSASDRLSFNLFGSYEDQRQRSAGNTYTANSTATTVNGATAIDGGCYATIALRNANNKIDPCLNWTAVSHDVATTIGTGMTVGKLLGGKLDLAMNLVWGRARTATDVSGGSYVNNPFAGVAGNPTAAVAAYYVPATGPLTNTAQTTDIRLGAHYRLSNESAMRLMLRWQRLRSTDWRDEGFQPGGLTQLLPSYEQAPNHSIHSIGVSYVASF